MKKDFIVFVDEMQTNTSKLLAKKTEARLMVNADTERLGLVRKRKGNTKKGSTITLGSPSNLPIKLLKGLDLGQSSQKLFAIQYTDVFLFDSDWDAQSLSLSSTDEFDMVAAKGYGYLVGLNTTTRSFSSAGTWSTSVNVDRAPKGKFAYFFKDQLFIGNCSVNGLNYPKRVYHTNIILKDDEIKWGLEFRSDLSQAAGSRKVTSASASFKDNEVDLDDVFIITSGDNAGVYYVDEIIDNNNIVLNRNLENTATNSSYVVGSNFFDLNTDVRGLGEHYGTLLAFEYNRVWKWSNAIGKKEVYGAQGTSSHKSIVNNHRGYTFWYHPSSGIIMYNGSQSQIITEKIQEVIDGISTSMYTKVVGWPGVGRYKNHVYFYVGDVSNTDEDIEISKAIIDYNIARNSIKVMSYNAEITAATVAIENDEEVVYLGTTNGIILKFNQGNTDYDVSADDGSTLPISWYVESHPFYPRDPETMNQMLGLYLFSEKGTGIKAQYKLHGTLNNDDENWSGIVELNGKYTQEDFRDDSYSRGISFKIQEYSKEDIEFSGISVASEKIKDALDQKEEDA